MVERTNEQRNESGTPRREAGDRAGPQVSRQDSPTENPEVAALRRLADEAIAHDRALVAGLRSEIERLTLERDEALAALKAVKFLVPRDADSAGDGK